MGALLFTYVVPRYNWPRSYVNKIAVLSDYQVDPALTDGTIEWTSAAGYIYRLVLADVFAPWSSNVYTVDHMFDEDNSSIDCVLFPCFDGLTVSQSDSINDGHLTITVHPAATLSQVRLVSLAPAPSDYWLPVSP